MVFELFFLEEVFYGKSNFLLAPIDFSLLLEDTAIKNKAFNTSKVLNDASNLVILIFVNFMPFYITWKIIFWM